MWGGDGARHRQQGFQKLEWGRNNEKQGDHWLDIVWEHFLKLGFCVAFSLKVS